jgi:hypothetical protein
MPGARDPSPLHFFQQYIAGFYMFNSIMQRLRTHENAASHDETFFIILAEL